jgi:hypothetical protein
MMRSTASSRVSSVADQLLGEREVALITHHEVVELHDLAGGAGGHSKHL